MVQARKLVLVALSRYCSLCAGHRIPNVHTDSLLYGLFSKKWLTAVARCTMLPFTTEENALSSICNGSCLCRRVPNELMITRHIPRCPTALVTVFKYDTVHGTYGGSVENDDSHLIVDGKKIKVGTEPRSKLCSSITNR